MFTRLRLAGFKSFVEPAELVIERGLTGIVGPNGCGKSNLVEAVRWVMGETSARKMRGGAMEDVIFAGTTTRAPRNLAEVTLKLDNAERKAPPAFNQEAEIEITRRIARDQGSLYRVNGREVRARDVQLLFADLATGAGSTAMVSQGRVGALINAKPVERRSLLEEAAGIGGLHARRHEAELRLKAAEANLARLDDVTSQIDGQLQALKRQSRQASRYRNLSDLIRRAEAIQLRLRHEAAAASLTLAETAQAEAEEQVKTEAEASAQAAAAESAAAEALPPLRERAGRAATALQRLVAEREGLAAEVRRAEAEAAELEARLGQVGADEAREQGHRSDAETAIARLETEAAEIRARQSGEAEAEASAEAAHLHLGREVETRQKTLDELTHRAAELRARRDALSRQTEGLVARLARFEAREAEMGRESQALNQAAAEARAASAASAAAARLTDLASQAGVRLEAAERSRLESQAADAAERERLQQHQNEVGRLSAEEKGLSRLLAVAEGDLFPPLIDAVRVAPGFEAALGAALGDDLGASGETSAPIHWRLLPPLAASAPLPEGARPLSGEVEAPPSLARRLGQTGLVEAAAGDDLQPQLAPGQRLVSRAGDLWRWDGYTRRSGAPTAMATRLEQRNRLLDLRQQLAEAERRLATQRAAAEEARGHAARMQAQEAEARNEAKLLDRQLAEARTEEARALQQAAARSSRLAALSSTLQQVQTDLAEARAQHAEAKAAADALPAADATEGAILALRPEIEALRGRLAETRAALEQLRREAGQRRGRAAAIADEITAWRARAESAGCQLIQLAERRETIGLSLAEARERPAAIAGRRAEIEDAVAEAEAAERHAAAALSAAEDLAAARSREAKAAALTLASARETRARIAAEAGHGRQAVAEIVERIREVLECTPDEILSRAGIKEDEALPPLSEIEHRLERLRKERDGMGPVNLRAEIEARELEEQLELLRSERADLEAAIARLRQGIASLNREGRERLLDAFRKVDGHFQGLFTTVFGGGRAHLALTDSEDPLEAGLEIMAEPPGKKLQLLSLLSGGEQALTALALLFAVFLTNPAPLCVLDEVDAPLDDANVERMCDLLDRIATAGDTRFLVVTHHPITMARMDRLFGVTMAERGVSQLVSVDLATAESFRQSA